MFLGKYTQAFSCAYILTSWNVVASYTLHIERENQISETEWLAICESDSSLTVQHVAITTNHRREKLLKFKHQTVASERAQY